MAPGRRFQRRARSSSSQFGGGTPSPHGAPRAGFALSGRACTAELPPRLDMCQPHNHWLKEPRAIAVSTSCRIERVAEARDRVADVDSAAGRAEQQPFPGRTGALKPGNARLVAIERDSMILHCCPGVFGATVRKCIFPFRQAFATIQMGVARSVQCQSGGSAGGRVAVRRWRHDGGKRAPSRAREQVAPETDPMLG